MSIVNTIMFMVLGHLISDYTLQGWLADGKQKSWWRERTNDEKYKNDWVAAILCHSMYWSLITFFPMYPCRYWAVYVVVNALMHAFIDHAKANLKIINLQQDQAMHMMQIVASVMVERAIR